VVTRDGMEAKTNSFLIRRGEEKVLEVTYTPNLRKAARNDPAPPKPAAESEAPASRDPEYITTRTGQIRLKRIPAGAFLMGSADDDKDAETDEKPQHRVRITRPFYLGLYEVTQTRYVTVMGYNPSWFSANNGGKNEVAGLSTDRYPVENVSWLDAVNFCNKLGEMESQAALYEITGENVRVSDWNRPGYRLPTEAEWEYACRANAPTVRRFSFGDHDASLAEFAWYDVNSGNRTHPVGEKRPNGFGLFDMHGNVREWCWDGCDESFHRESSEDDPRGLDAAWFRVSHGGGWLANPVRARSAHRMRLAPGSRNSSLGFRLALVQPGR
jgi:eukaryotic-like serine/threonine-protein kinase